MENVKNAALKDLLPPLSGTLNLPHFDLLHYLLSQSDGKHVAHCLDLDLVTVASTQTDAAIKLDKLVKAHIELALATGSWQISEPGRRKSFGSSSLTASASSCSQPRFIFRFPSPFRSFP